MQMELETTKILRISRWHNKAMGFHSDDDRKIPFPIKEHGVGILL